MSEERPGRYVLEARRVTRKSEGEWVLAYKLLGAHVRSEHQYRPEAEAALEVWSKHPKVRVLGWVELRMRIAQRSEGDTAPVPPAPVVVVERVPARAGAPVGGEEGGPTIADLVRAAGG